MKLLIITQKVDLHDDVLGFFHSWIEEFGHYAEKVTVICLEKGQVELGSKFEVLSLGKEHTPSKIRYVFNLYRYVIGRRRDYDAVFVHMNPEYVVLAGPLWRLWGKKVALWYAHGTVNAKLRLAVLFSHVVFTSTDKGLRLQTKKKMVVGQGIDANKFTFKERLPGNILKLVAVGRLSHSKDCLFMIKVAERLALNGVKAELTFVGEAVTAEDYRYKKELVDYLATSEAVVHFAGPVSNHRVSEFLSAADMMISASRTGSLDKTIVEALATGLPVVSSNDSAVALLQRDFPLCVYEPGDIGSLISKISAIRKLSATDYASLGQGLRALVVREHSLSRLIGQRIAPVLRQSVTLG